MKKHRKTSLLLTLLIFALQALSCGGSGTSTDTAADTTVESTAPDVAATDKPLSDRTSSADLPEYC